MSSCGLRNKTHLHPIYDGILITNDTGIVIHAGRSVTGISSCWTFCPHTKVPEIHFRGNRLIEIIDSFTGGSLHRVEPPLLLPRAAYQQPLHVWNLFLYPPLRSPLLSTSLHLPLYFLSFLFALS